MHLRLLQARKFLSCHVQGVLGILLLSEGEVVGPFLVFGQLPSLPALLKKVVVKVSSWYLVCVVSNEFQKVSSAACRIGLGTAPDSCLSSLWAAVSRASFFFCALVITAMAFWSPLVSASPSFIWLLSRVTRCGMSRPSSTETGMVSKTAASTT